MTDDDADEYTSEDWVGFVGCTCDHEQDQHGWGHCDVDGCACEGGWEE